MLSLSVCGCGKQRKAYGGEDGVTELRPQLLSSGEIVCGLPHEEEEDLN